MAILEYFASFFASKVHLFSKHPDKLRNICNRAPGTFAVGASQYQVNSPGKNLHARNDTSSIAYTINCICMSIYIYIVYIVYIVHISLV